MKTIESGKLSFRELKQELLNILITLKSSIKSILILSILGGLLGMFISFMIPKKYNAFTVFNVEENSSSLGGLSSIAGQFGFDIGSLSSSGYFTSENMRILLTSQKLIREVLMMPYNSDKSTFLIDKYIEVNRYETKWKKIKRIQEVHFSKKNKDPYLTRLSDSLINVIIEDNIVKNEIEISRPDKKASYIRVDVRMRDELMSKLFCSNLIKLASEKYIASKLKVKRENLGVLQAKSDSIIKELNFMTRIAANSMQPLVDINPGVKSEAVNFEIKNRDKQVLAAIFAEVTKNLEITKTLLSHSTPVVEIIDEGELPLKIKEFTLLKGFVFGFIILFVIVLSFFVIRKYTL
jgi:capsular polysaccharide biosynthesis protein